MSTVSSFLDGTAIAGRLSLWPKGISILVSGPLKIEYRTITGEVVKGQLI
jgi:hypothetical protein